MIEEVKNDLVNFIKDKPLNWYPNLLDHSVISGLRLLENNKINKDMIQYFAGSDSIHRNRCKLFFKRK